MDIQNIDQITRFYCNLFIIVFIFREKKRQEKKAVKVALQEEQKGEKTEEEGRFGQQWGRRTVRIRYSITPSKGHV